MATVKPRVFFSKVRIARELLREKAEEIFAEYMDVLKLAKERGDHKVAMEGLQYLMDHMPSDDDGSRMVEPSVDKQQQQIQQDTRPSIQIGIQVGGVLPTAKKALPPIKTEVTHVKQ